MKTVGKSITFMGKSVTDFIENWLFTDFRKTTFSESEFGVRLNMLASFIKGNETERFAAEPVYAVTGTGKLKSKGVEGLQKDVQVREYINSDQGILEAIPFIEEIENRLNKPRIIHQNKENIRPIRSRA